MKAAYRGIQDVKAAIGILEWIMKMATLWNYASRIIICGQGTGGWIAVMSKPADKLAELQLPKFLDAVTAIPLIDTAMYVDSEGFGGNPLSNMDNHVGAREHDMILNMGGLLAT